VYYYTQQFLEKNKKKLKSTGREAQEEDNLIGIQNQSKHRCDNLQAYTTTLSLS
jgi:hypothetical protein